MKISQYLYRRSSGHYYFRMRTPRALASKIKTKEIKFSLKTTNRIEAQKRVLPYAAFLANIESMNDIDEILRQLTASGSQMMKLDIQGMKIGNVEIESFSVDPSKEGDVEDAIKFVNGIQQSDTSSNNLHQSNKQTSSNPLLLKDVISRYVSEMVRPDTNGDSRWNEDTRDGYIHKYDLLLRILGEKIGMVELSRDTGVTVKDILLKLPRHINQSPKYQKHTLDEIVKIDGEKLSNTTVNRYLNSYKVLFEYAMHHQYCESNFFSGLTLMKNKKKNKREYRDFFKPEQIPVLFIELNSRKPKHSYSYWAPRIALFSGMRLNEICQLYISDIRIEDDIYFFDINDDEPDKSLKTPASKRWIPIHSKLIDLGLIERVKDLKRKGKTRLFEGELKFKRNRYSPDASKWFGRVRRKLGWVGLDPMLDFHSFRHNVATALQENDIPEYRVSAILGHEAHTESFNRYGKGFSMTTVKADIESIVFPHDEIHVPSPVFKIS